MKEKWHALYVRVSSMEQAQSKEGSLVSQIQRLKEYLFFHFGESARYIVYQDSGKSGKDTNRPAFQKMTEGIRAGDILTVLCTEISRVSRSVIDFHKFIDLCNQNQVGFISLRQQFDTTTSNGKLVMGIFASVAQFEREQISERTSANIQARARRGLWNGGYLYGYIPRSGQGGYIDASPHESAIVNLIYDKYLELGSYCKVAEFLNSSGYLTREYTTRRGDVHPAGAWSKTSILQILKNPAYIGKRRVESDIVDAVWQPIVDKEKWQQVQEVLKTNLTTRSNNVTTEKHTYILSGLVKCMHCQTNLENGSGSGNKGKKIYFYYRHPTRKRKEDCQIPPSLPAQRFEEIVYQGISIIFEDKQLFNMVIEQVEAKVSEDIAVLQKRLEVTNETMTRLENEGKTLTQRLSYIEESDIQTYILPRFKEIKEQKGKLLEERQTVEQELYDLKSEKIEPDRIHHFFSCILLEFHKLTQQEKQRVFKILIARIEISDDQMGVYMREYRMDPLELLEKVRAIPGWLPR